MSYGLSLGWGGPTGRIYRVLGDLLRDIIATNLVQGSYKVMTVAILLPFVIESSPNRSCAVSSVLATLASRGQCP